MCFWRATSGDNHTLILELPSPSGVFISNFIPTDLHPSKLSSFYLQFHFQSVVYLLSQFLPFIFVLCVVLSFYPVHLVPPSLSLDDHESHVRQVLETLRKEKLYDNHAKCFFALDHIDFLGFVVSYKRVHIHQTKVEAI